MSGALYGVYGTSGCGRGIMPIAREQLRRQGVATESQLVFIDEREPAAHRHGQRVVAYDAFLEMAADERFAVIAVANGEIRERLAGQCEADGVRPWTVRAASSVEMDGVTLGDGAALLPFTTLTSDIRVGRHFHLNLYAYVEHDCVIGDFVTFAPGAKCNGNIVIEDHAYIGSGAVIRQGRPGAPLVIGRGALVGMGAVVTKSVAPGVTVVGNPARPLVKP